MLHGNTMSSKLFEPLLPLYQNRFRVILIDFLGHGQSDRLSEFPVDFWADQAAQVIALVEKLELKKVRLLGTGGGAIAALNAALLKPFLFSSVIADSFESSVSERGIEGLRLERAALKLSEPAQKMWKRMHGRHWESVVDNDTAMRSHNLKAGGRLFIGDLKSLSVPTLFTASREDRVVENAEAGAISLSLKVPNSRSYIFTKGAHPALLSNAQEFAEVCAAFAGID